jgi:general secretion pathway protein I
MTQLRCKGFTLIEVMVALSIVALSLTAVASSMVQMIDAANTMRDRTYASWIAQNKITEMRLSADSPEVSSSSGEVDYANTSWQWRAVVSETGVEDLYRIEVGVSLAGREEVIRSVTGFVGPPGPPGEANRVWSRASPSPGVTQ